DGKKIAFTARGEIFSASAKNGGDAIRGTNTPAPEGNVSWAPDSRKVAYTSTRSGNSQIFLFDFTQNREGQLTNSTGADTVPTFSPDGKMLAFERDAKELRVLDLDSKQERVLATGYLDRPPFDSARPLVWSPDSRYVAFMNLGERSFKNVHI